MPENAGKLAKLTESRPATRRFTSYWKGKSEFKETADQENVTYFVFQNFGVWLKLAGLEILITCDEDGSLTLGMLHKMC